MDSKGKKSVQESFLDKLKEERTTVHLFLISGIKLVGRIVNYDQYAVELNNGSSQVVFKSAISTVMPVSKHAASPGGGHKRK